MTSATAPVDPRRFAAGTAGGDEAPAREPHFRPDIQGLRAVAVGLVVADHVLGWPAGGFIGVDVFFVISGFLITSLLVRERSRTGRISFRAFYARRARRLLPAALLTLAATTAAAWFLFLSGRFQETVHDVVWAALFSANIKFARDGTDYFEAASAPSLVQHFWSLAVEEQFYLVWPALILLAFAAATVGRRARPGGGFRRFPAAALCVLLGAVTAASFAWSLHATAASPVTAYFSTFTRAWELGVGALVAVVATQLQRLPSLPAAVLAWSGLAFVLAAAFTIDEGTAFPGGAAALPVLGAALLLAWGGAPGGPGAQFALGSTPAGFLGAISYSLYLWHWPVLIIAGTLLTPDSVIVHAGVIATSLVLATVSFYCVEQPVLHTNWLLPSHRSVDAARARPVFVRARNVGLAAAAAALLGVGAVAVGPWSDSGNARAAAADAVAAANRTAAAQGMPSLTPLQQDIQAATLATEWPEDLEPGLDELPGYLSEQWGQGCLHVTEDNVGKCLYGDPDAEQSAVVLGDSFAAAWLPGLRQELVGKGWSVQSLTYGVCPNITAPTLYGGQTFTDCIEHRDWAIEHIVSRPPTLVVLSHSWRANLRPGADVGATYRGGLEEVVRTVQASGAKVVILGAPPGADSLLTCPTSLNGPDDCLRGPADTFASQMASEQEVAAATGVRAIDPEQWFCSGGRCPTIVGRTPVYADGLHLTAEYSERIGPDVVAAILQP
ncbi:acyltransferase family protein [Blastococcus goldschmidtiae]|uniref:Acyltransferase family protein n=1 Tax=Blastococcus goldschmidtiae TaxID=3075546 RepID=A0ABU2K9H4_9ACTN|nr:acyltransferase family protein [Blastococcus sp. DSM 46792]MDT0276832.1 acyltransferase family protein [Blastococcus sp. DSM 46792]